MKLRVGLIVAFAMLATLPAPASAQTRPGIVMAAFGGGNGDTWREMIGKPFSQSTSIPTQIVDVANTEVAIRASASNLQYNVAWSSYFGAATLYNDGLIEDFDLADFPELRRIPERFILKAPNGRVIGLPVQLQYYGVAFNTKEAKAADFPSWTSLGESKWKGRLAQAQAYIGAVYDLPMYAHIAGGDESNLTPGLPEFKKYAANATTILTSFAQGNTLLSRGEIAAVPFYSARVRALKREGAPVDIVVPKEGAVLLPYMLVVPKGAKNREALMKFLRYSLEPQGQLRMYDYSGYIPMNSDATLDAKQTAELGMPLPDLLNRLYIPNIWVQAETLKATTAVIEKLQAER